MPSNVVQTNRGSEPLSAIDDEQSSSFGGQKKPAPFLQDHCSIQSRSSAEYLKTEPLSALISHLKNAVKHHGRMQVVVAEHGRGKSALVQQLIAEAGEHWRLCYIQAEYHLGVDHILSALGQAFVPEMDHDFESLVRTFVSQAHPAARPVVVIDDAQNISSYALETLVNLKRAVARLGGDIAIILCATPALKKTLSSHGITALKERWIELHAIPRFDEVATTVYLKKRFEKLGAAAFTPAQLAMIHRRSCGIPANINYHAELVLGRPISDERLRLSHQQMLVRQKKIPYFIGGGAALLLLLILTIVLLSTAEQETHTDEPMAAVAVAPMAGSSEAVSKASINVVEEIKPAVDKAALKKAEIKQPAVIEKPKPVPVKVQPKVVAEKVKPTVKAVATINKPKPAPVANKVEVKNVEAQKPTITKPALQMAATAGDEAIPGVAWLKAQPPANYTIQLAGSPDEKNIVRHITRSSLEGELAYVLLKRKNRSSWYVVLHGSFKSRADALAVVEFFPPELRKNKPWIRQFSKLISALDES